MKYARHNFYANFINELNSSDPGKLFRITKNLLGHRNEVSSPAFTNKHTFANEMGNFFVEKITKLHNKLDSAVVSIYVDTPTPQVVSSMQSPSLDGFLPHTESDVKFIFYHGFQEVLATRPNANIARV